MYGMKIVTLVVGPIRANCYLIIDQGGVGVIDAGGDIEKIIEEIEKFPPKVDGPLAQKIKPVWVASTHGHFDHYFAAAELSQKYKIPFYQNSKDDLHFDRLDEVTQRFNLRIKVDPRNIKREPLEEGDTLKVGGVSLKTIATPGHSSGSVSFYSNELKALFTGDLLFDKGIVGRTDLPGSSADDLWISIDKVLKLPDETIIYPGHAKPTTIAKSKSDLNPTKSRLVLGTTGIKKTRTKRVSLTTP